VQSDGHEVPAESLKDRGRREIAAIDEALASGTIDDRGWHDAMAALLRPSYLGAATPWEQSGKSGDEASWTDSWWTRWTGAARFCTAVAPTAT
jgi:hypothetical protein